jgi:hypothetical protein
VPVPVPVPVPVLPVPDGLVLPDGAVEVPEPVVLSVLPEPEGLVDGLDGDGEVVGGEAAGVRLPGVSPTRSVCDSVQPARTDAPSASAQTPVSNLYIGGPPCLVLEHHPAGTATRMPRAAACLDSPGGILYY